MISQKGRQQIREHILTYLAYICYQAQNGQKKYQVNLRSGLGPIQVMLINRETRGAKPVMFSVPPPDDVYPMPAPPSAPADLQRCSLSSSENCSLEQEHLKSPATKHPLTPSSTLPDIHMGLLNMLPNIFRL